VKQEEFNEGLLGFLDASPTPFHATRNMAMMFKNCGFEELDETSSWELQEGKKYFVTRNGASLIAFTYPKNLQRYIMVGAHTDSPNLRLKPNPVIEEHGVVKFGVESYGGMLLNPWFDRDLSIAGRITYRNKQGELCSALVDAKTPLAIIPSLAIHLDDKANKDRTINKQTDINPIITTHTEAFDFDDFMRWLLAQEAHEDVEQILAHELSLYDTQKASLVGLYKEFIMGARLDNLLSCYTAMVALSSLDPSKAMLFVASDDEEVGSDTVNGAGGNFLQSVLQRITPSYEAYIQMARKSLMVSVDNAHAIHPNYPAKHDSKHAPYINKGVVIKINANQRYTSTAPTIAQFINVAQTLGVEYQQFVTRSDMGCGSTIGPITATRIGIDAIDVGLPTYAMHSIRESAGAEDGFGLCQILIGLAQ